MSRNARLGSASFLTGERSAYSNIVTQGRNARLGSASFLTSILMMGDGVHMETGRNARLGSASFLTLESSMQIQRAHVRRNARLGSASFLTNEYIDRESSTKEDSRNARLGSASFLTE